MVKNPGEAVVQKFSLRVGLAGRPRTSLSLRPPAAGLIAVARLVAAGLGLVSSVLISRSLGPSGRGAVSAGLALLYFFPVVVSMGVGTEISRIAATSVDRKVLRTARRYTKWALLITLPTSLFIVPRVLGGAGVGAVRAGIVVVALSNLSVGWIIEQSWLLGLGKFRQVAIIHILPGTTVLVVVASMVLFGSPSVAWLLYAAGLANVSTYTVARWFTRAGDSTPTGPSFPVMTLLRHSWVGGIAFAADAAFNRIDQIVGLGIMGAHQAGLYSVAVTFCTIPVALSYALSAAEFKRVAVDQVLVDSPEVLRSAIEAGSVCAVVLAICCPFGIKVVFGGQYRGAVPASLVMLVGSAALLPCAVAVAGLLAAKRRAAAAMVSIIGVLVDVSLLLLLGERFGALGAAIAATAATYVSMSAALRFRSIEGRSLLPRRGDLGLSLQLLGLPSGVGRREVAK
jgi:O-antigen/teichoic acid export membrane protein